MVLTYLLAHWLTHPPIHLLTSQVDIKLTNEVRYQTIIHQSSNYPSGRNPLTCQEMEHSLKSCNMRNRKAWGPEIIRTEIHRIGFTLLHEIRTPILVFKTYQASCGSFARRSYSHQGSERRLAYVEASWSPSSPSEALPEFQGKKPGRNL